MELEKTNRHRRVVTPPRRHTTTTGTFANRRSQYVPTGNIAATPSSQAARAAA
jgi:hypothetical protein